MKKFEIGDKVFCKDFASQNPEKGLIFKVLSLTRLGTPSEVIVVRGPIHCPDAMLGIKFKFVNRNCEVLEKAENSPHHPLTNIFT